MRTRIITTAVFLLAQAAFQGAQAEADQPVAAIPMVQQWTKFTDPQEGAFSIDLPQGWKNVGGTARLNALQYRTWVSTVSPDGMTIVAINDPNDRSYIAPSPLLEMSGFRVGSIYNGGGPIYVVEPYQSGQSYATLWGQSKLARLCTSVQMTESRARPDLEQSINPYWQWLGIGHSVGEASFTCRKDNLEMTAYVLVSVTSLGYTGIWYADTIEAFVAPSKVAGIGAGMLAHMVHSVEVNSDWLRRNSDNAAAISRASAETNAAISDTIMRSWEARGAVIDRVMEEGSRARLGIDVYANPATGTRYVVDNAHQYYWANPGGTVVGTDTDTAPNGFSRLTRVPPK